jgi:hypothetical protein
MSRDAAGSRRPCPPAMSAEKRNRVMLVDGRLCEYIQRATWAQIVSDAIRTSRRRTDAAVAVCKLGDARTLRRFDAGREVTT